jgi:ubiquitin carboxyl-terminal hydrolase 14
MRSRVTFARLPLPVCLELIWSSLPTDAEECWTQMMNALKDVRGLPSPNASSDASAVASSTKNFVDQYMTGEMRRESGHFPYYPTASTPILLTTLFANRLRCVEAPEEGVGVTIEKVLKIECNIGVTTSYMLTGIMAVRRDSLNFDLDLLRVWESGS